MMLRLSEFPWTNVHVQSTRFSFGDLRIDGYMHLPGAYRSLSRPSSVIEPRHPLCGTAVVRRGFSRKTPFISYPSSIGSGGLSTSPRLCTYTPNPIYPIFYGRTRPNQSIRCRIEPWSDMMHVSGHASRLDAFSAYHLARNCWAYSVE